MSEELREITSAICRSTKEKLNDKFVLELYEKYKEKLTHMNLLKWLENEVKQRREFLIRSEKYKEKEKEGR